MACLLGLWILSLWPADDLARLGARYLNDKTGHFLSYLVLAWLLCRGWPQWPAWLCWVLAFVTGMAIEVAQIWMPTRDFEWLDLVANGTGALLGVTLGFHVWRWIWHRD